MADILILGMKMPADEPLRLILNPNGQLFVDHGVTFTEYEAIELPPHGDLIDRDATVKESKKPTIFDLTDVPDFLHEQPVIIPSNKGDSKC